MDIDKSDGWIGIDEAATYLDVNKDTIRRSHTQTPAHRRGEQLKLKRSELET